MNKDRFISFIAVFACLLTLVTVRMYTSENTRANLMVDLAKKIEEAIRQGYTYLNKNPELTKTFLAQAEGMRVQLVVLKNSSPQEFSQMPAGNQSRIENIIKDEGMKGLKVLYERKVQQKVPEEEKKLPKEAMAPEKALLGLAKKIEDSVREGYSFLEKNLDLTKTFLDQAEGMRRQLQGLKNALFQQFSHLSVSDQERINKVIKDEGMNGLKALYERKIQQKAPEKEEKTGKEVTEKEKKGFQEIVNVDAYINDLIATIEKVIEKKEKDISAIMMSLHELRKVKTLSDKDCDRVIDALDLLLSAPHIDRKEKHFLKNHKKKFLQAKRKYGKHEKRRGSGRYQSRRGSSGRKAPLRSR